jgi:hypothetical protein
LIVRVITDLLGGEAVVLGSASEAIMVKVVIPDPSGTVNVF